MHGRADEDVSDVDVEANRMKNTHLLPGNCPFGHLSALKQGKMKMNTLIRTGNMNRRFEGSVVYWEERELNLRSKQQISYTTVIRPPLIISWKL